MPERDGYAPGTPSWVDIGSTDLDATHAFYTGLFGWEREEAGPAEETGGYGFYTVRGKWVAGYGPAQAGGVWWTTYISVDDADVTAKAVEAAGGTVMVPPMDVMTAGRMAVCTDAEGAAFSLWQPGDHKGAQLVNEPGALCWNELQTRDPAKAKAFYTEVFGWGIGGSDEYTEWKVGDETVGAMMPMPPMVPAEVPPNWLVYFAVDDCDAAVAKVADLGGQTVMPPMDIEGVGRFAVNMGPHGEVFAVIKLTMPS